MKFGIAEQMDSSGILRREVMILSDLSILEEELKVYSSADCGFFHF